MAITKFSTVQEEEEYFEKYLLHEDLYAEIEPADSLQTPEVQHNSVQLRSRRPRYWHTCYTEPMDS